MKPVESFKILFSPTDANPYLHLLAAGLENHGAEVILERNLFTRAFNYKFLAQFRAVHLHWLQPLYHDDNIVICLIKSFMICLVLAYLGYKKIPIVVTMHNLLPHKMKFSKIDLYFRRKITRQAKAIIFHSDQARSEFIDKFGEGKARYEVIQHGAYPESLVPLPNKEEARTYLGIPADAGTVCLFMGRANDQKGYDIALSHLDHLHEKNIHVIFAGADFKREHFAGHKNCTVRPYFIPDFELPVLFAAADCVLLPYRSCTTSGVAVLSIGFGVPVVCSDLPALREICKQNLGVVCNHLDPEDFIRAITATKQLINKEEFRISRDKFLADCSWDKVAEKTLNIYNRLL